MQLFICPSLPEIVYNGLLLTAIYMTVLGLQNHHPLKDVMRLAAWHVSGITYRSEEFLQGQPAMCSSHSVQGQKSSIQRLGNVFVAGVIGNREILFKQI